MLHRPTSQDNEAAANNNPWGPAPTLREWALDESVDFEGNDAWDFDEIMSAGEKLSEAAGRADAKDVDFVAAASPLLEAVKGRISSAFRS